MLCTKFTSFYRSFGYYPSFSDYFTLVMLVSTVPISVLYCLLFPCATLSTVSVSVLHPLLFPCAYIAYCSHVLHCLLFPCATLPIVPVCYIAYCSRDCVTLPTVPISVLHSLLSFLTFHKLCTDHAQRLYNL